MRWLTRGGGSRKEWTRTMLYAAVIAASLLATVGREAIAFGTLSAEGAGRESRLATSGESLPLTVLEASSMPGQTVVIAGRWLLGGPGELDRIADETGSIVVVCGERQLGCMGGGESGGQVVVRGQILTNGGRLQLDIKPRLR